MHLSIPVTLFTWLAWASSRYGGLRVAGLLTGLLTAAIASFLRDLGRSHETTYDLVLEAIRYHSRCTLLVNGSRKDNSDSRGRGYAKRQILGDVEGARVTFFKWHFFQKTF